MTTQVFTTQASEAVVEIVDDSTGRAEVNIVPASEAVIEVTDPSVTTVVEVSVPQPQQPVAAIRIDGTTNGIIYVGRASYGSSESAAAWTITRSTYNTAGVRLTKLTAIDVTWTGRAGHSYS